jgi:SAM-dependent methyltransferase
MRSLRQLVKMRLSGSAKAKAWRLIGFGRMVAGPVTRLGLGLGMRPYSEEWGFDRGLPIHRWYIERFLEERRSDIRGHCLEFQEDSYSTRFGEGRVSRVDVLHVDPSNPRATIVADITRPNAIPSDTFDCIICTHVLHLIYECEKAATELHRILRPGGILLVTVPHVSMGGPEEIWRFTPRALDQLLRRTFGEENVRVAAFGNSLAAAAEIRGLCAWDLTDSQKRYRDQRFDVEVCGRALKA